MRINGVLRGHTGWVTSIATPDVADSQMSGDKLEVLSASRDKSVIQWKLEPDQSKGEYGRAHKGLRGHSHFVSDVVLSRDGNFALSASWDKSLRLWDLNFGTTHEKFTQGGHTKDVLSVAFSADNRQIVSGSRDCSIKIWNALGDCRLTMDNAHNDWVSSVKFSPNPHNPIVVSGGWDKVVRVWSLQNRFAKKCELVGHTGYVNTVAISPDGSLCATGGKDGKVLLWDLNEGKKLHSVDVGDVVHSLSFAPNRFWLCAGTASSIKIIDLASKECIGQCDDSDDNFESVPDIPKAQCTSLAWSPSGSTLFAGYTDALIRVWAPHSSTH